MAVNQQKTLGSIIQSHGGLTTGFDYLRIALAVAVVLWHSVVATDPDARDWWLSPHRPWIGLILPMFFCLSGFLVAGSLQRTARITDFLQLRAIRIVPALAVEILLSAIILGPLLTTVPLSQYFTDPVFYVYFLNIVGWVHYELPGLFLDNVYPNIVNINLWTLPAELYCYIALALLALFKVTRKPPLLLLFTLACLVFGTIDGLSKAETLQMLRPTSKNLIFSFLFGVTLYVYRDKIPHNRLLLLLSVVLGYLLLLKGWTQYLAIPFVSYLTVYLGLLNPPKKSFLLRGDYSYGLYLFAFPLQQVHAMLFAGSLSWLGNVTFGLTFGLLYAYFSWNLVEKPILQKKNAIIRWVNTVAAQLLDISTRLVSRRPADALRGGDTDP